MDWSNERHVRLYTRDTVSWKLLPWQGKALWPLLLRKFDRSGLLDLGDHGVAGVAALVELPIEIVEAGLAALVVAGYVVTTESGGILAPNFLAAQEAPLSDAQRQRDSREKRRAAALSSVAVTKRDESSQNVTKRHARSHDVTRGHSSPIQTSPIQTDPDHLSPSERVSVSANDTPPQLELVAPEADANALTPESLLAMWNEATGGRTTKLEPDRRDAIRKGIRRQPDPEFWRRAFAKAAEQRKQPDTGWLSFDWMFGKSSKGLGWNAERMEAGALDFRLRQGGRQRDMRTGTYRAEDAPADAFTGRGDITHEF